MNVTNPSSIQQPFATSPQSKNMPNNIDKAVERPRFCPPTERNLAEYRNVDGLLHRSTSWKKGAADRRNLLYQSTSWKKGAADHRNVDGLLSRSTSWKKAVAGHRNVDGLLSRSTSWKKHALFKFRRDIVGVFDKEDEIADGPFSVSSFQQVFNQIKAENPTAPMGAVQQMTIRYLAEMKRLKREEADEEKTGLAVKTLHKFVDAIRVTASGQEEGKNANDIPFGSGSCDGEEGSHCDRKLSFKNIKRLSAASRPSRRTTQESSYSDIYTSSETSLNYAQNLPKARTANEMYAIAAMTNLAPRKSVNDVTSSQRSSFGDLSDPTVYSLQNDICGLLLEELAQTAQESKFVTAAGDEKVRLTQDDDSGNSVVEMFTINIADSTSKSHPGTASGGILSTMEPPQEDIINIGDLRHSALLRMPRRCSEISALSSVSSCAAGDDGLIVGFRPHHRCSDAYSEDGECLLNAGVFASDFSAWEK